VKGIARVRTKDDETGAHGSSHSTTTDSLQSEEHARNQKNTADRREHSHRNVGNTRLNVVLANLLEVEASIETSEPSSKSDKHLGQGRVDVHKELALDVLGSKTTEAIERVC
jgi:hypothetical protein